jgi:hypothetical protein
MKVNTQHPLSASPWLFRAFELGSGRSRNPETLFACVLCSIIHLLRPQPHPMNLPSSSLHASESIESFTQFQKVEPSNQGLKPAFLSMKSLISPGTKKVSVRFNLDNNSIYYVNRLQSVQKGIIKCVRFNLEDDRSKCFRNDVSIKKPTKYSEITCDRWGDISPPREIPLLSGLPTSDDSKQMPKRASESKPRLPERRSSIGATAA